MDYDPKDELEARGDDLQNELRFVDATDPEPAFLEKCWFESEIQSTPSEELHEKLNMLNENQLRNLVW